MHSRPVHITGAALVLAMLAATSLVPAEPAPGTEQPALACIRYWPEARYRIAYDHVVHVVNTCPADAQCSVSTNVDPDPVRVDVPRDAHIEVITRVGSPAREFTPIVSCRLAPRGPVAP